LDLRVGARYETPDRSLSLSGALFFSRVDNLQLTKLVSEGTAGRTITNAGQSESKGIEVSLRYLPYENLSLFAEYGLVDARFVKYETLQVIGGIPFVISRETGCRSHPGIPSALG